MLWARVDNRLIHGQIIETWIPFIRASWLVVANDELSKDVLQQEIMSLAIPQDVNAAFVEVEGVNGYLRKMGPTVERSNALILFASCEDARRSLESGLSFSSLNIGNLHYGPGKKQLCPHVAVSSEDESCLRFFSKKGVELDFRCVPTEAVQVRCAW